MQRSTLKFCRVCGFRVRVWGSYRTSRSFGYGYGSVTEVPEVPGIVAQAYRTHRSSGRVQNMMYPYPGYCGAGLTELTEVQCTGMKVLQNFQNFRVLWHGRTKLPEVPGRYKHAVPVPRVFAAPAYRTSRSSGYGYECPAEVTVVLCRVIPGVNTQGMVLCVPYRQNENRKFGYGYECRTELTDVPGTDRVVHNS